MADPTFQAEQIPEYHEGVLILKVRSTPQESPTAHWLPLVG